MKHLLISLFACISLHSLAQAPQWEWGRQAIGGGEGLAVGSDVQGNAYLTGAYEGGNALATIQFDTTVLQSPNYSGVFLVKYAASGNFRWAVSSVLPGYGYRIATDHDLNVYLTGITEDTAIIFGTDTLVNYGFSEDAFLVKYDSSGHEQWAHHIGGPSQESGVGIATDVNGNVFITGTTYSTALDFEDTVITTPGDGCIFLAKYDSNGNRLWQQTSSDSAHAASAGVVCDSDGNSYISGSFAADSITFGNYILHNADTNFFYDMFLVKYDPSGNVIWARKDGGVNDGELAFRISSHLTDNRIVVVGPFGGSGGWTFGPSSLLASSASGSVFIAEYDTAGNPQWASQSTGTLGGVGFGVDADANGNAYISGGVNAPGTFVLGSQILFYPVGADQAFVAAYDSTGTVRWAKRLDNAGDDESGIAVGTNGDVFFGGDFVPAMVVYGPDTLHNSWGECPFIAKINAFGETGIHETYSPGKLNIYPNPFSSSAFIRFPHYIENAELKIYDRNGRCVSDYDGISGTAIQLQRGNLVAGVYFATLLSRGEILAAEKLVIVNE